MNLITIPIKSLRTEAPERTKLGNKIDSMKWSYLCFVTMVHLLWANGAIAQRIELKSLAIKEDKLEINFDLVDSVEARFYTIRVYSSADGYLNPLEKTKGDFGLAVKPGPNKKITWSFNDELSPGFADKIAIEIRAKIFIPFINTESINQYKVFKRKRTYNLTWSGGTPQNILNFDLLKGEEKVTTFPDVSNVGHHSFEFPVYIKPGNGYRFRISDTKNKDELVFTDEFRVKRKIPLSAKLLPGLLLGFGAYFLFTNETSESDIPDAPINNLPPKS